MWEEAEKRGIKMQELLLFGFPIDTYVAELKSIDYSLKTLVFSGLPRPAGYINNWLDLMDDKLLLKERFIKEKLPVPAGGAATNYLEALKIVRTFETDNRVIDCKNQRVHLTNGFCK